MLPLVAVLNVCRGFGALIAIQIYLEIKLYRILH